MGLGLLYLNVFLIFTFQGQALFSSDGILPINSYSNSIMSHFGGIWESLLKMPSLFYIFTEDLHIKVVGYLGLALSLLLIFGFSHFLILFLLWILHLSIVNSGQIFYSYGWEIQLLELTLICSLFSTFKTLHIKNINTSPHLLPIWLMRWMLFRLMFGAGMIKIRGDACWTDFTCLIYHFETQPNPHILSWIIHSLPNQILMAGVLFNHFVELIVPFGYFGPKNMRRWAGAITLIFQVTLILSGNLAWLNWITLLMCFCCFDDQFIRKISRRFFISLPRLKLSTPNKYKILGLSILTIPFLFLSKDPLINLFAKEQAMNSSYDQWHLLNSYGAFGSIGKVRREIIIYGTLDDQISENTKWEEYIFKCKPGPVEEPPCWITPYHLRLDWQIWFSAMRPELSELWLIRFVIKLLEGNSNVIGLLKNSPFGKKKPKFIKMDLYHYEFASLKQLPRQWWYRKKIREYMPPVSLDTPQLNRYR